MRKELIQVSQILHLIQKTNQLLKANPESQELRTDILDSMMAINLEMFGCKVVSNARVEKNAESKDFCEQVDRWHSVLLSELHMRQSITMKVDYDFYILTRHVQLLSKEELVQEGRDALLQIREMSEENYQNVINFHNRYSHFWGKIDIDRGIFELLNDRVDQLKDHLDDFIWLYGELADYRSKKVLYGILHF